MSDGSVFKQTVGIAMGTSCDLLADLFLCCRLHTMASQGKQKKASPIL